MKIIFKNKNISKFKNQKNKKKNKVKHCHFGVCLS